MSTRRQIDELLVYGYLRMQTKLIKHMEIPEDIMNICLILYHIKSFFFTAGGHCNIDEDKTTVTCVRDDSFVSRPNCCYGSVIMPSISCKDIEYKYKVKIVKGDDHIAIGIDDAKCQNTDADYAGIAKTKNYAYYNKEGTLFSHATGAIVGAKYGQKFAEGDVITVCYNPYKARLLFYKNDKCQGVIDDVYADDNLSYRLCILMGYYYTTCVELL